MQKPKFMIVIICVLLSVLLSVWVYRKQYVAKRSQTAHYQSAAADVIKVFPARFSRYGVKVPRYGIRFKLANGEEYTQFNCELNGVYQLGDKVDILYDPIHPDNPVVEKEKQ